MEGSEGGVWAQSFSGPCGSRIFLVPINSVLIGKTVSAARPCKLNRNSNCIPRLSGLYGKNRNYLSGVQAQCSVEGS